MYKTIIKSAILYLAISLIYLFINAARCIRIVYIANKYNQNFQNNISHHNKDYEFSIVKLSYKASINYYRILNYHEILDTISKNRYRNNYEDLFDDIASRFRQKMKRFLSWPLILLDWLSLHLFHKSLLHINVFFKSILWAISVVGEYYLVKIVENIIK